MVNERDRVESTAKALCFINESHSKYLRRAVEKKKPLEPWLDHDYRYLLNRLLEEVEELRESLEDNAFNPIEIADECKDVANIAWFIYERAKGE